MEVAVSRKFFAFTPSMPLVLGWIRFLFDSNSSSLTYWSHIFLKNDKIIQFLILRNRHSTIKAILTARFGEVEVAVGRKFNCALTVVLCREWRLRPPRPLGRSAPYWSGTKAENKMAIFTLMQIAAWDCSVLQFYFFSWWRLTVTLRYLHISPWSICRWNIFIWI